MTEDSRQHKFDVFMSYQWDDQETVQALAEKLKGVGLKVWLDLENMTGCKYAAMADGIDNSQVIFVCMSEKYEQSPNCKREAIYAVDSKRNILPLKMQANYYPNGWLKLILGSSIYIKLSGKDDLDNRWQEIVSQMNHLNLSVSLPEEFSGIPEDPFHADRFYSQFNDFSPCDTVSSCSSGGTCSFQDLLRSIDIYGSSDPENTMQLCLDFAKVGPSTKESQLKRIKRQCKRKLGSNFEDVYKFLKEARYGPKPGETEDVICGLRAIVENVSDCFLVEQLLFLEQQKELVPE